MVCISKSCSKYAECEVAVLKDRIELAEDFANFGYGSISAENAEMHWSCGELGNYKMFQPRKDAGTRIETSTVTFSQWNKMVGLKRLERIADLEEENKKLREELHRTQLALERKNKLLRNQSCHD